MRKTILLLILILITSFSFAECGNNIVEMGEACDIGAYEYPGEIGDNPICEQYPLERYDDIEIAIQIDNWYAGTIELSELIRIAKIWKYCD